jgi:glycosyltransferase involved in cell wall biosynthesis
VNGGSVAHSSAANRPLLVYWGRRGALSHFVLELARVTGDRAVFSLSRQNELFDEIRSLGNPLVAVDTFDSYAGGILRLPRILRIRTQIMDAVARHRIDKVVVLMSHIWTPFLAAPVRQARVRYAVIVHDAVPHPGDITALANRWLLQDALWADEVMTLSARVAEQLESRFPVLADRVRILFLPTFATNATMSQLNNTRLPGFLFFGRIMAYKGLPLFVEACEILRARGFSFRTGVAGEGSLRDVRPRLEAMGAHVTNRWIEPNEVEPLVKGYDVMVAANTEASQSGVIALAYSYGLPVVATPVGGIVDQVDHGSSGLLAREVSATALADAMQHILAEPELIERLRSGVRDKQQQLSMSRFLDAITGG